MNCYKCGKTIPEYSLVCSYCGAELSARARMNFGTAPIYTPRVLPIGMLWFKILIYAYLFIEAFSFVMNGLAAIPNLIPDSFFTLESNMTETTIIHSFYQLRKSYGFIDIIYAVLCLCVALFAVITRNKLSSYKKTAPLYLMIYLCVSAFIKIAYFMGISITASRTGIYTGDKAIISSGYFTLVWECAVQAVFVYLNYKYFKKRKQFFIN